MFSIDLKDTYFQIPVHPESRPYFRFCLGRRVSVPGAVLWPVRSPAGVHQSHRSGFGVDRSEGSSATASGPTSSVV